VTLLVIAKELVCSAHAARPQVVKSEAPVVTFAASFEAEAVLETEDIEHQVQKVMAVVDLDLADEVTPHVREDSPLSEDIFVGRNVLVQMMGLG